MAAATLIGAISQGLGAWSLPGDDPATPATARSHTRSLLVYLDPEVVYDVLTVVSELVTNAVRYTSSGSAGGRVVLGVAADCHAVAVSVLDQGGEREPVIGPADRLEGGLGLMICAELGELEITGGPDGRLVTCLIPLEEASC